MAKNKIGILIVGLGGNNGVTLVAGLIANKKNLKWESSTGIQQSNYYGCITQLNSRGQHGGVGFKDLYDLADANSAVVAGWDIRPTLLGEALYDSHVLDYDLVRQVREEMNSIAILPGAYDPSFIGESQHYTATHILQANTNQEKLETLRQDIRRFKTDNSIDGHISVIWSASVERPCLTEFKNADDLLQKIQAGTEEVSPSILYATAAILEGCSFTNGGSQNTLSDALVELAERHGVYCLGTDYKAGQTKFKTCALEYIRALGLKPKVMASSNHLGNNDMLNLTTKKTLDAKMRVKHNIFEAWEEEELDHKVCVMYTPFMGDEKRDVVEYTSQGFLGAVHTMLTYTRCMDSVLCVPLMIDGAVWCDFFHRHSIPGKEVAKALAYLFKVPEGEAKGVDPGFFKQMDALNTTLKKCTEESEAPTHDQKRYKVSLNQDPLEELLKLAEYKDLITAETRQAIVALATSL